MLKVGSNSLYIKVSNLQSGLRTTRLGDKGVDPVLHREAALDHDQEHCFGVRQSCVLVMYLLWVSLLLAVKWKRPCLPHKVVRGDYNTSHHVWKASWVLLPR